MKKFLLLLAILLFTNKSFAFEVILPEDKKYTTNSNYAFFIGRASGAESLSINGKNIYIASNGAFAHSVKLKNGQNRVVIRSNYSTKIYNILKNKPQNSFEPQINDITTIKGIVNYNNVPLRSAPIDGGLNRIGHLFEDTELIINGEKGDFYRVILSKNKSAWIAKKDVTLKNCDDFEPAEFKGMNTESFKNANVQTIELSKKLPYTVEDKNNEIIFRIYNPELSGDSVYNLNLPKTKKYTYSVSNNNGKYSFKVKNLSETKDDYTIVIDAGHGGSEKGAIGCLGHEEKDINLKVALELGNLLKEKGYNVILTREVDCNVSLQDRVNTAKENEAEIFVSIHLNSIPDIPMNVHKNRGTSTYYFNDNAKTLAGYIQKSVVSNLGTPNEGVKTASFAVIRPTEYVGVLVETAYMTNPIDSVLYTSDKFASKTAKGICAGIEAFIQSKH